MMDTLLTLLGYVFLALLLISGVVALLKEPGGLGRGLAVAVGVPALLGGIVAGWWLYQTCPVAGWGLAALFVSGFACATGHESPVGL
jgi:hypothetical protein